MPSSRLARSGEHVNQPSGNRKVELVAEGVIEDRQGFQVLLAHFSQDAILLFSVGFISSGIALFSLVVR